MSKLYSRLLGLGALLGMLGSAPAWAQTRPIRCVTEEVNAQRQAELQRLNPGYNPARSTNSAPPATAARTNVVYTLPVVFHVIHNGEPVGTGTNLNRLQIQSQLDVLNEDYRNLNADAATVVPTVYQPRRGDTQIQFVLAQRDPSGATMLEPGIDRVNRATKGFSAPPFTTTYTDATIKPQTYWNPEQYINIWVENISGGVLGYAQFPDNTANLGGLNASGGAANTDGVVILYYATGSRTKYAAGIYDEPGTAAGSNVYDRGRTLTHELGHWFSMRHIWGDANCGTDYVTDTPTQQTANFGCVAFPHITCANVTGDMSQNYMDYSDDRCMAMFTANQAARVQAVMAAGTPRRANLVNSPVLCPNGILAATAASSSPVCAGSTINLTATGPAGATYAWTGPNNFTSTSQNPTIANATAAMAGDYLVRVSVAGSALCSGVALTSVVVSPAPAVPAPTSSATADVCPGTAVTLSTPTVAPPSGTLPSADFNNGLPTGWAIGNTGAAVTQWQITAGNTYTYSAGTFTLTNYTLNNSRFAYANSDAGGSGSTTNTTLTTPSFSTVGYSSLTVAFQHYFRPLVGTAAVEVSVNGGTTWTAAASYTATVGTPTAPATASVNLGAFLNQPNVRVRWHLTDSWGYIWAIDNVVFTGTAPTYNYTYSLVSGDGLPATTNTPTITVTPTQTSVYRVTVGFSTSACTSSSTVTVNVVPPPPVATVTASSNLVCSGTAVTLTGGNLPTGTGFTYQWAYAPGTTGGTGLPATVNTPTITVSPTTASSYVLRVTNSCNISSVSAAVAVGIIPPPVAPATPTVAATQSILCGSGTTTLTGGNLPTATTGITYTYQWTVVSNPDGTTGNGLPTAANTPTITVSPTVTSTYQLTVTATNVCGVSASTSSVRSLTVPTVIVATNAIQAYPVPFGDAGLTLDISTCTPGAVSAQLYDSMGRLVYDQVIQSVQAGNNTKVMLPGSQFLGTGKYTLKVQQNSQNLTFNVVRL